MLRYDFQVPAGFYVLVKPIAVAVMPFFEEGVNGWWNVGAPSTEGGKTVEHYSDSYKMTVGTYENRPWIEVRDDTATYWGGVWYEINPFR